MDMNQLKKVMKDFVVVFYAQSAMRVISGQNELRSCKVYSDT